MTSLAETTTLLDTDSSVSAATLSPDNAQVTAISVNEQSRIVYWADPEDRNTVTARFVPGNNNNATPWSTQVRNDMESFVSGARAGQSLHGPVPESLAKVNFEKVDTVDKTFEAKVEDVFCPYMFVSKSESAPPSPQGSNDSNSDTSEEYQECSHSGPWQGYRCGCGTANSKSAGDSPSSGSRKTVLMHSGQSRKSLAKYGL